MTIVATTPLSDGSKCYGSFTFDDGATIRVSGGLNCSQHGRRHCKHHKAAHSAIVAKAASQEAATATPEGFAEANAATALLQAQAALSVPAEAIPSKKRPDFQTTCLMTTILAATAELHTHGQIAFRQFAFADGAVVTNRPGLICSQHGPRHCLHYGAAADAISVAVRRAEEGIAEQLDEWPPFLLHVVVRLIQEEAAFEAIEAADAYSADYDAYLDSLPA